MSAHRMTRLTCDYPTSAGRCPAEFTAKGNIAEVRLAAKDRDWTAKAWGDVCPTHSGTS